MSGQQAHILVIDDDDRLRKLLQRYLSGQGFLVSAAESAASARAMLAGMHFDLLVMDVMMPGESGLELTRALAAEGAGVPVLMLTARGEPSDRIAGLEAGADDYLAKPFEPRELMLRINAILRRRPPQPAAGERAAQIGPWRFDQQRGLLIHLEQQGQEVKLTQGEAVLLAALAEAGGQVVAREALQERSGVGASSRSIDVQVTRLRRKIEPDPGEPRYLMTVRGEGYVLHCS